jgi:hypothetical protein
MKSAEGRGKLDLSVSVAKGLQIALQIRKGVCKINILYHDRLGPFPRCLIS